MLEPGVDADNAKGNTIKQNQSYGCKEHFAITSHNFQIELECIPRSSINGSRLQCLRLQYLLLSHLLLSHYRCLIHMLISFSLTMEENIEDIKKKIIESNKLFSRDTDKYIVPKQ